MAKKSKIISDYTPQEVLALGVQTYNSQGFVRSGDGYIKVNPETGEPSTEVKDNKSLILDLIADNTRPSPDDMQEAKVIMDKFSGKFMLKKLQGSLSRFETSVSEAFTNDLTNFTVAVIASIPHMNVIDKVRQTITDKIEELRFKSDYFGEVRTRYDLSVEIIDVKFIQTSGVYMITSVYNDTDIIKFWWRDQPDISDIINGKTVTIRGTVLKHENSKYSKAKETMLNRVKIMGELK